ncbi:hypothetical protein MBRA1_003766 [Malassezia brasiliensis]|uniref:Uncharacterized protein n=1 Tax=Malassezia brasiliensis TaxID=1821822 RepID=A0AAF0DVG3_9BASI|nr:hypothetical protein MBRA1_003766 [Malassezia brasiliensis]
MVWLPVLRAVPPRAAVRTAGLLQLHPSTMAHAVRYTTRSAPETAAPAPGTAMPTSGVPPASPQTLPPAAGTPLRGAPGVPHRTAADAGGVRRPSKHRLVYGEVIAPMAWVLAYSTATYFALALAWNWLARDEERAARDAELATLRTDIRAAIGGKAI